jgi:hypothetical protein
MGRIRRGLAPETGLEKLGFAWILVRNEPFQWVMGEFRRKIYSRALDAAAGPEAKRQALPGNEH